MVTTKPINLTQLQEEMATAGVTLQHGLTATMADYAGPVTLLEVTSDAGETGEPPAAAQPVIDAHVAQRPKTDAEYSTEFQTADPARKQQIRDQMNGLEPREQVPMTMTDMWGAPE